MSNSNDLSSEDREQKVTVLKPSLDWNGFLYYLGYDLTVRTDVERLIKNFVWLDKKREKSEKSATRRNAILVTLITALGTGIITVTGSWILKTLTN